MNTKTELKARFDNDKTINKIIDAHFVSNMSESDAVDMIHLEVGKIVNTLIHNCEF